jgi:SAM-dependent methyltransferase
MDRAGLMPVRASAAWLHLREPADATARAEELVDEVRRASAASGAGAVIHDLGCGSGSMARWLAVRLPGPQHWVMYDRDRDLLAIAAANAPTVAGDGREVSVEVRRWDVTRLDPSALADATLVTASALLDMMTAAELESLVALCSGAHCPVLITLSVTGHVTLTPPDPLDQDIGEAFNAHQRRLTAAGRLLGPDAVATAADDFGRRGLEVRLRPSPWRLGPGGAELARQWLLGWVGAACEQRPAIAQRAGAYTRRRLAELAAGDLSVVVHHEDLLARPR